ncbi:hypothetical protein VNO80_03757 [Phaseolus coccineus]|uniref:Uncharacterized protein n=1 Tax=Phaseolus coccineus TaxID=3886 RepID=A0AAN9RRR9_PHACN
MSRAEPSRAEVSVSQSDVVLVEGTETKLKCLWGPNEAPFLVREVPTNHRGSVWAPATVPPLLLPPSLVEFNGPNAPYTQGKGPTLCL